MHSVSAIASVTASPRNAAPYPVISVSGPVISAKAVKTGGWAEPAQSSPVQNPKPAAAAQPNLPLGLLESAAQPPTNNTQANLDYSALRTALQSGNLAAAQQAYLRLQTDIVLPELATAGGALLNQAV